MKRIVIFVVLALAFAALGNVANAESVSPKSFQSLQPFKSFPKGEGEGVAYRYDSRNKAQFVALLRDKNLAKREMRVSCDVLVRQMMEGHKTLPFEGCEGTAAAIENNGDFTVVACRDEMFQRENWLAVTNENGSAFGIWHRQCLSNEQVLTYKGQPLISLTCLNAAIPVVSLGTRTQAPTAPNSQFAKPSGTIAVCPDVYTLKVNVWENKAITLPNVGTTHAKEELAKKELKERFVGVAHVSRTHGGQFRKAYAAGELHRSAVAHGFRVSLTMTPESSGGESTISSEQVLGDITVTGLRELQFTRAQLEQWDMIRLAPIVNDGIKSPPRSNITGLHELRFFNHLPGKKLGEWEDNPVPDCIMNEHWIEE